jgi:hypothetical protein
MKPAASDHVFSTGGRFLRRAYALDLRCAEKGDPWLRDGQSAPWCFRLRADECPPDLVGVGGINIVVWRFCLMVVWANIQPQQASGGEQ